MKQELKNFANWLNLQFPASIELDVFGQDHAMLSVWLNGELFVLEGRLRRIWSNASY